MINSKAWYLEERAFALAHVYLTRRNDLVVTSRQSEFGPDLIVDITKSGKSTGRIFGVELKATTKISQNSEDEIHFPLTVDRLHAVIDIPYPIIVLVFDMNTDIAYYNWINRRPLREVLDTPVKGSKSFRFRNLTNEELDNLISDIELWYDMRTRGELENQLQNSAADSL